MADQWYYSRGGQQAGPVTTDQLRQMVASGQLTPQDLVWADGMANWQPLGTVPQLGAAGAPMPQPGFAPPGAPYAGPIPGQVVGYQPQPAGAKGMAITGFVLSLCGLLCAGVILGIVLRPSPPTRRRRLTLPGSSSAIRLRVICPLPSMPTSP